MADIAQPGLVKQFADQGTLKPITYARRVLLVELRPAWVALGTFDKKIYGLVFKASNKSTVWYNVLGVQERRRRRPDDLAAVHVGRQHDQGLGRPAYSIGGADGWTLTDLFENIYLRQAGPAKYALLSAHKIKWTDSRSRPR